MNKFLKSALFLMLFAAPLIGCGGDEEAADGDTTEADGSTDEAGESSGDGGSMASLQKELYETILAIETVEDAKAADEKIGEIFSGMADLMREMKDDPQAAMAMQNDPEYTKYSDMMTEHIEKISTEDPMVGLEIGTIMLKHADKVMEAATEMLDSDEMSDALEEAGEALEEAEKALDDLSGE